MDGHLVVEVAHVDRLSAQDQLVKSILANDTVIVCTAASNNSGS
jgi:hypothetical protein